MIELCKQYFKPNKEDLQIIKDRYIQCDSLKVMRLLALDNRLNILIDENVKECLE